MPDRSHVPDVARDRRGGRRQARRGGGATPSGGGARGGDHEPARRSLQRGARSHGGRREHDGNGPAGAIAAPARDQRRPPGQRATRARGDRRAGRRAERGPESTSTAGRCAPHRGGPAPAAPLGGAGSEARKGRARPRRRLRERERPGRGEVTRRQGCGNLPARSRGESAPQCSSSGLPSSSLAALILPRHGLRRPALPMLGEATTLSDVPDSRTWWPRDRHGRQHDVRRLQRGARAGSWSSGSPPTGTELASRSDAAAPGTVSIEAPQIAVSGDNVYVAWMQGVRRDAGGARGRRHQPRRRPHVRAAGDRRPRRPATARGTSSSPPTATTSSSPERRPRPPVDRGQPRRRRAPSRAGRGHRAGRPATAAASTTSPSTATRVHWMWLGDDFDVIRAPLDGRRPHARAGRPASHEQPGTDYPGAPQIDADGGVVAITTSQEYRMPREDHTGTDFGDEPGSCHLQDGGRHVGRAAHRRRGQPLHRRLLLRALRRSTSTAIDVYVGWRGQGSMWLAQLHRRRRELRRRRARSARTLHLAHAAARRRRRRAATPSSPTWHTAPRPEQLRPRPGGGVLERPRPDVHAAHGRRPRGQDLLPVGRRLGPGPAGRRLRLVVVRDATATTATRTCSFAPLSASEPDVAVHRRAPVQAAKDAARLAAGRPTTIRAKLRSRRRPAPACRSKIELAYDDDGRARRAHTSSEDVVAAPGREHGAAARRRPDRRRRRPHHGQGHGPPNVYDTDPSNDAGEGSRAVVQPRPLTVLFVPVAADDELRAGLPRRARRRGRHRGVPRPPGRSNPRTRASSPTARRRSSTRPG